MVVPFPLLVKDLIRLNWAIRYIDTIAIDRLITDSVSRSVSFTNPQSVTMADNQGSLPLHLACQVGDIDIVKYSVTVKANCFVVCSLFFACVQCTWRVSTLFKRKV